MTYNSRQLHGQAVNLILAILIIIIRFSWLISYVTACIHGVQTALLSLYEGRGISSLSCTQKEDMYDCGHAYRTM